MKDLDKFIESYSVLSKPKIQLSKKVMAEGNWEDENKEYRSAVAHRLISRAIMFSDEIIRDVFLEEAYYCREVWAATDIISDLGTLLLEQAQDKYVVEFFLGKSQCFDTECAVTANEISQKCISKILSGLLGKELNDKVSRDDLDYYKEYFEELLLPTLEETLAKIEAAVIGQHTELDLSFCQLTELPEVVTTMEYLQKLDLSNNTLNCLPSSIIKLKNLRELDLSDNELTEIPEVLGELRSVRKLDFSNNRLEDLPGSIVNLSEIIELDLSHNKFSIFPGSVLQLQTIKELYLSDNKLLKLPELIANLAGLRVLFAWGNKLNSLPVGIGMLDQLQDINLRGNKFVQFPTQLTKISGLKVLDISRNSITYVPDDITNLEALEELHIEDNPIKRLSKVISVWWKDDFGKEIIDSEADIN